MSDVLMPEKIVNCKVDVLIPYEKNSRVHPEGQLKQIMGSIAQYGFLVPVLVDENKMILAGHGRVEAAKRLGFKEVPCIESKHLSADQKRAFIIADNKIAENAEWDQELLALELSDLESLDFDLSEIGFDDKELKKLLYEGNEDPEEGSSKKDENAAPDLDKEPVSKLGDIWILGQHRLMCGDSTDEKQVALLMDGAPANMIFTDPPYGMSYGGGREPGAKRKDKKVKAHGMIKGDDLRGDELVAMIRDALKAGLLSSLETASAYVCFPWRTYSEFLLACNEIGLEPDNCLVWVKNNIGLGNKKYRPQHEFIFFFERDGEWQGNKAQSDIWDFRREATGTYVHPTQKPVKLVEKAVINSSKKGDIVLDLFGGSGTTLIACEKRNRTARLMELDPKYCDVILRRWQEYTGGQAVHAKTGDPFSG